MKNNNQVIPKTLNSQTRKLISTGLLVASITTVPFKIASDYPYSSSTAEFRDLQNNFSTEDDLIVSKLYQEVEIFKKIFYLFEKKYSENIEKYIASIVKLLTENAIQDKNSDYKKIHFLYNRLVYYRAELFEHSNLKEWLAISREIDPTCKFRQIPHKFIQKSNLKSDLKKEDISWEPLDYELELKVENF